MSMPGTPYSAGASRRVHPSPITPAAKPRRLFSATQTLPSQKTPRRLLMASSLHTPVRGAPPGANMCACWHGKQPPSWRVAWQPPSPYLEDLTKTLVIAPPVRRRLQLVPAVRLKTASVSPYEPPRDAASRASRYIRARLQLELAEHHNRILWEREAHANASELGMDIHTYNMLLSMQHRDITPEDYEARPRLCVHVCAWCMCVCVHVCVCIRGERGEGEQGERQAQQAVGVVKHLLWDLGPLAVSAMLPEDRVRQPSPSLCPHPCGPSDPLRPPPTPLIPS